MISKNNGKVAEVVPHVLEVWAMETYSCWASFLEIVLKEPVR